MTTKVTLSPFDLSDAAKTGKRTFRKQVLKKGVINYNGAQVAFDDEFIRDCVQAFKDGAYDQVPFVLATPGNEHNMDPTRFRGEIVDLVETPDGLDAIIETTRSGAKVITDNPRLGVSARIVQGLTKVDGRSFPRAIQHVLATMDPRLTGMRPWRAVDLAVYTDGEEVLDLTAATVQKGNPVATKTKRAARPKVVQLDLSQLSDEQFDLLLSTATLERPVEEDEDDVVEVTETRKTKKAAPKRRASVPVREEDDEEDEDLDEEELDDDEEYVDELDEDEVDEDDEVEEEDEEEVEEVPVTRVKRVAKKAAPVRPRKKVELSTPTKTRKVSKARRLELQLADERWGRRKAELVREGVPPYLVDLAEPVLRSPDRQIIDLSESGGGAVDARKVVADLLDGFKNLVDLTPQIGHSVDLSEVDDKSPTAQALKLWDQEYGRP